MIDYIEEIAIENIRAIGRATIQPLSDGGQTQLNGPTGVGKSSVVDGIVFALFSKTPDQVPVAAMRRQGSIGACWVKVTFWDDGQRITVERGLKGKKDAPYATVHVDGREQVIGKIKAVNAWIINRLGGMDADGFMSAFVIRQKELAELVTATPAVRRARIEKLAGIDRMSAALKAASEEALAVKRRLDVLPGSEEEVLAARAALEQAQQDAVDAWSAYETARDQAATDETAFEQAGVAARLVEQRLTAHAEAVRAAQMAQHQMELAVQRAEQADAEVTRLTGEAAGGSEAEVTAARKAHDAARQAADENREVRGNAERAAMEAQAAERRAVQAKERATQAREYATRGERAAVEAQQKTEGFPKDLAAQAQQAQERASELADQAGALRGEWERLGASIKALTGVSDPHCPTCATALADPHALLETLKATQVRVAAEGKQKKGEQEQAAAEAEALRQRAGEAERARQNTEHVAAQARKAVEDAERAQKDAEPVLAEAERLAKVASEAATAAQAALADATAVQDRLAAAGQVLRKAESAAECASRLPQAQQAARAAHTQVTETKQRVTDTTEAEKQARVPEAEATSARDALAQAQMAARDSAQAAERARGDHRVAEQAVLHAEKTRDDEEKKVLVREETLRDWEAKTAVRDALSEFRKDRIARIAPEVSEIATDLIPRLTEGKYVSLELDEEFTPVVTDVRGVQRPAPMLSGGEEDAVALALRVAFSDLIAGQRGGPFIADEPYTAQDVNRRAAMATAIRELANRQVIIISHANDATDTVDLVLNVIPDDENGSSIEPASIYGVVDEAALDVEAA